MVKEFKDKFGNTFTPGKLSDKIKALNSTRVFKKVTPKGDLSWYIKWASSIFMARIRSIHAAAYVCTT